MATTTRIIFSVPKPPTPQATRETPDAALIWIRERMDELISNYKDQPAGVENVLDRPAYIVIYSTIRDYSVAIPQEGVDLGEKLYLDLVHAIRNYCRDAYKAISQQRPGKVTEDTALLEIYIKEWKRFYALAKVIANLYKYVQRHWVLRELDEGRSGLYGILDVQMKIWRDEVAMAMLRAEQHGTLAQEDQISILDVATKVRENDGLTPGEPSDQHASDLLDQVFGSFKALGLRVVGTWRAPDQTLGPAFSGVKQVILPSGMEVIHLHNGEIVEPSK